MNFGEAPAQVSVLGPVAGGNADLELELSETGPWDLAGLQLLLVLDEAQRRVGGRLRLAGVPGVLEKVAASAGLARWLAGVSESGGV